MYKTLESKASPSMRHRVHRTLRAVISHALEEKVIRASPLATRRSSVPRQTRKRIQPLTEKQITALLKAAKGHRPEAMFVLALDSGAREGELFGPHWDDVGLTKGIIHIRQAAVEIPKSLRDDPRYKDSPPVVLSDLKTEASRRAIDIAPDTVRALRARRSLALPEGLGDCPLVFPARKAGCCTRPISFARFGSPSVRPQAYRPPGSMTAAHDRRVAPHGQRQPQGRTARLGHASIVQTMDTYAAWIPSMQARAARAMGEILGRVTRNARDDGRHAA